MMNQIEIPRKIPFMTLGSAVLFPQAMMPLYIFEPRYRKMLAEVLSGERVFAVAAIDDSDESAIAMETPCSIAGVGIVRACKRNGDGSANLIIQGLARVEFEEIITEEPFRTARIHQVMSERGGSDATFNSIQASLVGLIQTQIRLGAEIPPEVIQFLKNISEPENVLDLAIYTLCSSSRLKQELLETRGVVPRYEKFQRFLRAEIESLKLDQKLKGELDDDGIGKN